MNEEILKRLEERIKCCPPIFGSGPKSREQQHNVAVRKRFTELYNYDPDFRNKYEREPEKTLAAYDLAVPVREARLLMQPAVCRQEFENIDNLPEGVIQYYSFFYEKLQWRNESQNTLSLPLNKAFRRWRQRQLNRCWGEFSGLNINFVHVPLVFELSKGCSVGCPFCALASERLQAVFRATEDNLRLWREVLAVCKRIVGPAAGEGVCYFASEPLDNPDYEVFSSIFAEMFGKMPQLTTAVALRRPERTRRIIEENNAQTKPMIHRFSILTLEEFRRICDYFTPDELLYVELMARYPESAINIYTRAGRAGGDDFAEKYGLTDDAEHDFANTISCSSGFIVNMAEKTIRLTTPCNADAEHPTGEIISARAGFTSAADFEATMLRLIAENMPLTLDMNKKLGLQKFLRLQPLEHGFALLGASKFKLTLEDGGQKQPFYRRCGLLLQQGALTGRELALQVHEETGADPAEIFALLRYLDKAGMLLY